MDEDIGTGSVCCCRLLTWCNAVDEEVKLRLGELKTTDSLKDMRLLAATLHESACREMESCGSVASWTEGRKGTVMGRDICVVGGAVNKFDHMEQGHERSVEGVFGGDREGCVGFFLLSRRWVREEEEEEAAVEVEAGGDKSGARVVVCDERRMDIVGWCSE